MSKETKLDVALRNATESIVANWRPSRSARGTMVATEMVEAAVRAGAKAVLVCADALPHSEHRGWDSLLDDIGAALSDDDCALRPCDVCSGQHTGPGTTCPACRPQAGPPDLGDVLRRAESAILDLPADEFEAFCAAHPGLWAALVKAAAGRG